MSEVEEEVKQYEKITAIMYHLKDPKMERVKKYTQEDTLMQRLKKYIMDGWPKKEKGCPTLAAYHTIKDELSVIDDVILKGNRVIIPKGMRGEILRCLHQGHWGVEKTKRRAREGVYWPGMNQEIERTIEDCNICGKYLKANYKESLRSYDVPLLPWQNVAVDLFHWNGDEYLLAVDHYSNYIEISKLNNITAETVINHLKAIFARHDSPTICYTDNGLQFNNAKFKEFEKEWKFKHITSNPEYHQSNGLAERGVQSIKRMLQKCLEDKTDPYLGMLTYRNSPVKGIASPAQLLMGRRLRSAVPETFEKLKPKTIQIERTKEVAQKGKQTQARYYNRGTKDLTELPKGIRVGFRINKKHRWGTIEKRTKEPRSYFIKGDNGGIYRRNRQQIIIRDSTVKRFAEEQLQTTTTSKEETTVPTNIAVDERNPRPTNAGEKKIVTRERSGRQIKKPERFKDYI